MEVNFFQILLIKCLILSLKCLKCGTQCGNEKQKNPNIFGTGGQRVNISIMTSIAPVSLNNIATQWRWND